MLLSVMAAIDERDAEINHLVQLAVERSADGRTNPMVNAGAIAAASLAAGDGVEDRWCFIQDGLSPMPFARSPVCRAELFRKSLSLRE